MSPALFVLCPKGLSHLLVKAESDGSINGVKFSTQGPSISHLLFTDDSIFMCKAEISQVMVLQGIRKTYGDATGQVINLQKSSLFGIYNEGGAGTYLGVHECFSGSKI